MIAMRASARFSTAAPGVYAGGAIHLRPKEPCAS